jgi:hypothetical protein
MLPVSVIMSHGVGGSRSAVCLPLSVNNYAIQMHPSRFGRDGKTPARISSLCHDRRRIMMFVGMEEHSKRGPALSSVRCRGHHMKDGTAENANKEQRVSIAQ